MKDINEKLFKQLADDLLFEIDENEYALLLEEFQVMSRQLEKINKVDGLDEVEPMIFPYIECQNELREDIVKPSLTKEGVLKNAGDVENGMVRVPKVIG